MRSSNKAIPAPVEGVAELDKVSKTNTLSWRCKYTLTGGGGWLDQVGIKLTQSPTGVGVGVGTELGNN